MDKQRRDAYFKLIENLLNAPVEKEKEVLIANVTLIDSGLLQVMEELAIQLELQGNQNTAIWLRDWAVKLKSAMSSPLVATPEIYRDFLLDVLDLVAKNPTNPQVVFSFLKSNLDKLNHSLAQVLEIFGNDTLAQATPESSYSRDY